MLFYDPFHICKKLWKTSSPIAIQHFPLKCRWLLASTLHGSLDLMSDLYFCWKRSWLEKLLKIARKLTSSWNYTLKSLMCCVVRCEKCKGTFWIILISHHHPSVRYIITVLIFSCKGELEKVSPSTFVYQEASQTTSLRRNSIWIFQKVDKVDLALKEAGLEYWNTGYLPAMWDVALDFQTNLNVLLILDVVHVIMFLDCILD